MELLLWGSRNELTTLVVDAIFEQHRTERPPKARPRVQRGLGRSPISIGRRAGHAQIIVNKLLVLIEYLELGIRPHFSTLAQNFFDARSKEAERFQNHNDRVGAPKRCQRIDEPTWRKNSALDGYCFRDFRRTAFGKGDGHGFGGSRSIYQPHKSW